MRRSFFISLLIAIGLLAGCGAPDAGHTGPTPTERPTAFALPTIVPTGVPAPTSPAAEATATDAPAEPPAVTTEPSFSETDQEPASPSGHVITIDQPRPNATISSPLTIKGSTNFWPFEASLGGVLKDASGAPLAQFPVTIHSPEMGQGGPFSEQIVFTPPANAQEGTLELYDASAKDGSILTIQSVKIRLEPAPAPGTALEFEQPEEGALVTMPLHVAFGGARGDEELTLRLVQNGAEVTNIPVRAQLGYVVTTLPAEAGPGPTTLEVARADGTVVARRALQVAGADETQAVKVAWVARGSEQIILEERRVPRTPQIATAALNELLWGPGEGDPRYGTALPTSSEVLGYSGREAGWGPRVRLLRLTITDGVAQANFSKEIRAYGGGSARVALIRQQIETTLRQFPSVEEVVIAVEGQTEGVLQP
jgi:hypothetical protein